MKSDIKLWVWVWILLVAVFVQSITIIKQQEQINVVKKMGLWQDDTITEMEIKLDLYTEIILSEYAEEIINDFYKYDR